MTQTPTAGYAEAGDVYGGFFGAFARKQSYLNIAYLFLSFPLGIFYFVFLVVGLSLGFGLLILGIGFIILLLMMAALRAFASMERQLGIWLLDARIPPPDPLPAPWEHPLQALKKYLTDSYTWKSLFFFLVKFPLGIVAFVAVVTLFCTVIALIATPLAYHHVPVHFIYWRIMRPEEALLCLACGLVLGLLSIHILNGLAAVNRAFVVLMLSGARASRAPVKSVKSGPVIIP